MSATCKGEYVAKQCMCLADPIDPYSKVCAYINPQNGLVFPCDPGCCGLECPKTVSGVLFHVEQQSHKAEVIPPDFNVVLPQSEQPSPVKGASDFKVEVLTPGPPIWILFIFPAILVFFSIIFAFLA